MRGSALFATEGFPDPNRPEAHIEDVINVSVCAKLVDHTYAKELVAKTLVLDTSITRIMQRYETALCAPGIKFHKIRPARKFKIRPARKFMERMGTDLASMLPTASVTKFVAKSMRERYERMKVDG